MPHPLYRASATRLLTFLECPKRYRLRYLTTPRPPPRPQRAHTGVGIAVHAALRDWWDLSTRHRDPAAAAQLVRAHWSARGFADLDQADAWRERAADAVARYVAGGLGGADLGQQPLGVERTVSMVTGPLAFTGRIDRLDRRAGPSGASQLVVVDYKTGRNEPRADEAATSLALALYAGAVWKMWHQRCVTVELHHLPSGTLVCHQHTNDSLQALVGQAHSVARDAQAADARHAAALARGELPTQLDEHLPANPTGLCRWCDVRAHCHQGQVMGPEMPDWAGLEGPDLPQPPTWSPNQGAD